MDLSVLKSYSMQKLKVITVVGTRPEIIRLSRTIAVLDSSDAIDHCLVHTGQNYDYELNEIFFEDLGIRKPDYFLEAAGISSSVTIAKIIEGIDNLLERLNPDAMLILGDTNSCLSALPAKKRKVPIFHMEAGNRCYDQRVPEETNRKIVDHIADINLTYSSIARYALLKEGLPSDRIIKTGSPMYEVLMHYLPKIRSSNILSDLSLKRQKYFLISAHREENINNEVNFERLVDSINQIASSYNYPIIFSTHPRTRLRIREGNIKFHDMVRLLKPLSFTDYNNLQLNSYTVLSDSGTISEESAILNFRALNIRQTHERHEAMEEASVQMVGLNSTSILRGLATLQSQDINERNFRLVADYSMPNVSLKIERILISYTSYVNRVVWGDNTI